MKHLFSALLLLFTWVGFAQETEELAQDDGTKSGFPGVFSVGAEVGWNGNHFNHSGIDQGFHIGGTVFYEVEKFPYAQLSSGLLYSQVGGRDIDRVVKSIPGSVVIQRDFLNRSIRMHSLEIPLKVHFFLPKKKGQIVTPKIHLGIAYNYSVGVIEKRDELWYSSTNDFLGEPIKTLVNDRSDNVSAEYKSGLFSLILGSQLDIKVSEKQNFYMSFEYRKGLRNMKLTPEPYAGRVTPNALYVSIGTTFLLN